MRRLVKAVFIVVVMSIVVIDVPQAASMLGVSTYAAGKVVDAIVMGSSVVTIIALILASGGSAGIAIAGIKYMIKTFGRKTAIAW